jgi:ubiquinone biosynthesis protein
MFPFIRVLTVIHVICRYRLLSLLPGHPALRLLAALQWLWPGAWLGTGKLSEGERLRLALERLGPIFIKMGQLMATRRDLLPPEWTVELERLQDDVAGFPPEVARETVERELGKPVNELFAAFDMQPLASASVAQVHPAVLHDGTEVVVKVLRPDIDKVVNSDLRIMASGARWLERLWPDARYFRPARIVDDYAEIIRGELDLKREAQNSDTMRRNHMFSPYLDIPPIHFDFVSHKVLVQTRIYAIPVNDIERIQAAGIDPKQLAERGVEIFFSQVFKYNFFHADMHPGNIFVLPDNPSSPQYTSVDAAICGQLSKEDQHLLGRLALMVMRQDFSGMVDLVIRAGWTTRPVDRQRFERAIRELVEPIMSQPLDQLEFAPLVVKLFDTARSFHIEAPVQYILLLKTLIHVEGLGRAIYPDLDIWTLGRPKLEAWMLEQYGPTATIKKLQARAPEWLASLPDMPDLFRDALENLVDMPRAQRDQEARLEQTLTRHRRKFFAGVAGIGAGVGAALLPPAVALAAGGVGVLLLAWALRR